mmetsp:Transcript_43238/g.67731  ORF Transcript_43238/g.67731 Transcript_43238/m.67731 type:complete len:248 (+) Transcript_43238:538-1281(+)
MLEASKKHKPADGRRGGLLLVEAFHYRFHPLAQRMKEIVSGGLIGSVKRVDTEFQIPNVIPTNDIRYSVKGTKPELAGGALMDAGCYAVNCQRYLTGANPEKVIKAECREAFAAVDKYTKAEVAYEGGLTGSVISSFSAILPRMQAQVEGTLGSMSVVNFLCPFIYHRIDIKDQAGKVIKSEKHYGDGSTTYEYQLAAFVGAVRMDPEAVRQVELAGSAEEGVKNMRLIDQIYRKAGLPLRQGPLLK